MSRPQVPVPAAACGRLVYPDEGLDVPAAPDSVIVRNVQDLTSDQQDRLMSWMDRHPAIQIISTATCPLYPCVLAGTIRSALYYRLNILYFAL